LEGYAKVLKDSVDQVTGSRAITIPDHINPDEEADIKDPSAMKKYEQLIVNIFFCLMFFLPLIFFYLPPLLFFHRIFLLGFLEIFIMIFLELYF
jgi:hypothetical protein